MNFFKQFSKLVAVLTLIVAVALATGCSKKNTQDGEVQGTITAAGSTALLPLLKPAQEEFQNKYPKVSVNISGGGSFTGQNQVAAGSVNIGNSDVPLQDNLKDKGLVEYKIVGIPFVFITNPDVNVDNLTESQYKDIFTGKITNWREVGGKDEKITIIHRAKSSGSRSAITDIVLKGAEFTDNAIIQDSNGAVLSAIATTPGAIGYVDAAYVDQTVKALAYNGVKYSIDNVTNGSYPVYTFGRMYTKGEAQGAVKAFIDYVMSNEFQDNFVEKNGFVPINKMKNR